MKIVGIIPARYASSRFPGKPLLKIEGKSMISRVYDRALQSKSLTEVIVATDDNRILEEVTKNGGKALLTSEDHRNGTERCAEVAKNVEADYFINIQGDEPYIYPQQIDDLASILDGQVQLGTLIKRITKTESLEDQTTMKVLKDLEDFAIYFSRTAIPFQRDHSKNEWLNHHVYWKHVGIYAYRKDILLDIVKLEQSSLEIAESLEQLRWIENGLKVKVAITELESISIDTPEDLDKLNRMIKNAEIS